MSEVPELELPKICANCEYFDKYFNDCLNSFSPRFQTTANETCLAFFKSTIIDE